MASIRQQKINEELRKAAGDFIARESNRTALITPTRVDIAPNLRSAIVFFTVLPDRHEEEVLHFLRRKRTDFRNSLKKIHFKVLPQIDFQIDYGEKNRIAVDEAL